MKTQDGFASLFLAKSTEKYEVPKADIAASSQPDPIIRTCWQPSDRAKRMTATFDLSLAKIDPPPPPEPAEEARQPSDIDIFVHDSTARRDN